MVSDGFQAQKRGSWKERAERVLANAISIDGRKEWTCKFCSESNMWTMQEVLQQHLGRVPWEAQAGRRCTVRKRVHRLFNVERRGRQKSSESGSRE